MKSPLFSWRRAPTGWLLAAIVLTAAAYGAGLQGPFLLDDESNFAVIQRWLSGHASLPDVLFTNTTGMFGRPVAMASLALSAWLGGYQPLTFKLGNLIVHLLCGCVIYVLLRRAASQDPRLQTRANSIAAAVSALWLLHPLHASTVLYAVQRMAQLSTLFLLLGMWLYLAMRAKLERSGSQTALIGLFLGIPLVLALGFLSKENAVLLPALCLVLELGCFQQKSRPRAVKAFFGLYLALPVALGLVAFALRPERVLGGYALRDFDWQQRLLSQGRALCDYLWRIIVPNPPRMGVYTDDFAISTGLLSPPTTLVSLLMLGAITYVAWGCRHRIPAVFIGWGLFLVGHAVESGIIPLELYFEHRNYLPMVGVLYALAGLTVMAGDMLRDRGLQSGRTGTVLVVGLIVLLAAGTFGRARVWSDARLLAESAAMAHPESMRAQLAVVDAAIRHNDLARAREALLTLTRSGQSRVRAQGHLNLINLDCATRHAADARHLDAAVRDRPARINQDEAESFELLLDNTGKGCEGIDNGALGMAADQFAVHAEVQPDWLMAKARLRHAAAKFHARDGDWPRALHSARLAWQPGMPPAASAILIRAQLVTGDVAGAERTYEEVATRVDPTRSNDVAGLRWLRAQIDARRQPSAAAP